MIPWWRTEFGAPEIAAVTNAINGAHISQGKVTRMFEDELAAVLGVPHVVCTTSGTTALTMALLAAGVGPGDEVIVPDRTWIATAHAVMMTGAKVKLVDVGPRGVLGDIPGIATEPAKVLNSPHDVSERPRRTFHRAEVSVDPASGIRLHRPENSHADESQEINPDAWADLSAYTERGRPSNIVEALDPFGHRILSTSDFSDARPSIRFRGTFVIPVHLNGRFAKVPRGGIAIEDSCQSFPKPPEGLMACYSFSTAKLLPTGQGGCVATRDEGLYRELKALRTHDVDDAMVPQVLTWRRFGYNFRYTDIQAALGLAQLKRLERNIERLREIRRVYEAGLWDAELLPYDGIPLYTEILHSEPERLRAYLLAHNIEARPFYPCLHTAPYLRPAHKTGYSDYEFPNAMKFASGLILPSGPCQELGDIERVCNIVNDFR